MSTETKKKRKITGVVVSDKMNKSRVVIVEDKKKHATYAKYMKTRTKYMVHDEENKSKRGNTVVFQETAPFSKNKKWEIVEILGYVELEAKEDRNGNAGH